MLKKLLTLVHPLVNHTIRTIGVLLVRGTYHRHSTGGHFNYFTDTILHVVFLATLSHLFTEGILRQVFMLHRRTSTNILQVTIAVLYFIDLAISFAAYRGGSRERYTASGPTSDISRPYGQPPRGSRDDRPTSRHSVSSRPSGGVGSGRIGGYSGGMPIVRRPSVPSVEETQSRYSRR